MIFRFFRHSPRPSTQEESAVSAETQKRRQDLHAAIGIAISGWSFMESLLVAVASTLLDADPRKVGLVLYSNQNFHVWLNIIDDLFVAEPKLASHRSSWTKISNDLRAMNDTRVRLAHHTTYHDQIKDLQALMPAMYDRRTKSQKYRPLEFKEVIQFSEKIVTVTRTLVRLVVAITITRDKTRPASPDKSPRSPDDQPQ